MSDFRLTLHEWVAPGGARGPELAATWARFSIYVNGKAVTKVSDERVKTTRDAVYLPLYPLAEWLASSWWSLWNESSGSGHKEYDRRHCLASAREGYSLPPLEIHFAGSISRLSWSPEPLESHRIEFLDHGEAWIDTDTARSQFAEFVQKVIGRLEEFKISGTRLQHDWAAIQSTTPEEREFCESVGALGLDPYALDDSAESNVMAAGDRLPKELLPEFFRATGEERIARDVEETSRAIERIQSDVTVSTSLVNLREECQRWLEMDQGMPWDQGYATARRLRSCWHLDGEPTPTLDSLAAKLGADGGSTALGVFFDTSLPFGALVGVNRKSSPAFVVRKGRESSHLFRFCRALCEYLYSQTDQSALVTDATTERQKRNRAFAAELLAPSSALRERVRAAEVGQDQVEELADEFGVSTEVVSLQLENHRIARVQVP